MPELADTSVTNAKLNGINTTNVAEGTRLYYTDARARASISENSAQLSYNSTTGVLNLGFFPSCSATMVAKGKTVEEPFKLTKSREMALVLKVLNATEITANRDNRTVIITPNK